METRRPIKYLLTVAGFLSVCAITASAQTTAARTTMTIPPSSYANPGGDVVLLPGFQYYLDSVVAGMSLSGNYIVRVQATTLGTRTTFILRWFATSGGAEVTNGTSLAGETVRLSGLGGTY